MARKNNFAKFAFLIFFLPALTSCVNTRVSKKLKQFPAPFQFVIIDSVSAFDTVLYAKAYTWMTKNIAYPKPVIELDRKAGIIVGKCIMEVPMGKDADGNIVSNDHLHYTFSVEIRNGKYRCMFAHFWHEGTSSARGNNSIGPLDSHKPHKINGKTSHKRYYEVKEYAAEQANAMLKDFQKSMGT